MSNPIADAAFADLETVLKADNDMAWIMAAVRAHRAMNEPAPIGLVMAMANAQSSKRKAVEHHAKMIAVI